MFRKMNTSSVHSLINFHIKHQHKALRSKQTIRILCVLSGETLLQSLGRTSNGILNRSRKHDWIRKVDRVEKPLTFLSGKAEQRQCKIKNPSLLSISNNTVSSVRKQGLVS